jgi:hypothetical protein
MIVRERIRKCTQDHLYYYCYGVVSHKASQALLPFSDLFCVPHLSSNHSWFVHQSFLAVTSRHLVVKEGEMAVELAGEVFLLYSAGFVFDMP